MAIQRTTHRLLAANPSTGFSSLQQRVILIYIETTAGAPKTGLSHSTSGFVCHVCQSNGGSATAVTLNADAPKNAGTISGGGFAEADATNMPGWYQFVVPAAWIDADDQHEVVFRFSGAASTSDTFAHISLQPISEVFSSILDATRDVNLAANQTFGETLKTLEYFTGLDGSSPAARVGRQVWAELLANNTTNNSFGKKLGDLSGGGGSFQLSAMVQRNVVYRNVDGQWLNFRLINSSGAGITNATLGQFTFNLAKVNTGSASSSSGAISPAAVTHLGDGVYGIQLTQAQSDADLLVLSVTHSSGYVNPVAVETQPQTPEVAIQGGVLKLGPIA